MSAVRVATGGIHYHFIITAMLQIKRLSDGKTWDVDEKKLIQLYLEFNPHRENIGGVSLIAVKGKWRLWVYDKRDPKEYDESAMLLPDGYSVTDTDSLPRSEVRRVLEERRRTFIAQGKLNGEQRPWAPSYLAADIISDVASALNLDLSQKGAEG